jgi:hypothetical protein
LFAWLSCGVFGPHAHFGVSAAGVSRGEHKFTSDIADPNVRRWRGFFPATCNEE